jgi:hypothetical protein
MYTACAILINLDAKVTRDPDLLQCKQLHSQNTQNYNIYGVVFQTKVSFNRLTSLFPNPFIICTAQELYLISKLAPMLMSLQSLSTRYSGNGALSSVKHTIDGHVTKSFAMAPRLRILSFCYHQYISGHDVSVLKGKALG